MLEAFKIKEEQAVRVNPQALLEAVTGIFERLGVPPEDARLGAEVLVSADLRGVDSHGVSNMLDYYIRGYRDGHLNPRPRWRVTRETPSTANIDCDGGLGLMLAPRGMEIAIRKARETGVGMVTMHNARHLGMAAYHAMLALPHGMIGVCLTATAPSVVPTFGREPRLGTNPIAVAVPAGEEPPLVFDAATATIASNKVLIAQRLGNPIPPGVLADGEGRPLMQPVYLSEARLGGFHLLPLGSTPELGSHKGYGLGCVVEALCGVLSAGEFALQLPRGDAHHMVAAISVEAFIPLERFRRTMDEFVRALKSTPPAPGHQRVLVPGQPEWEAEQERRQRGIPLHREVVRWLRETCAEMSVPCNLP